MKLDNRLVEKDTYYYKNGYYRSLFRLVVTFGRGLNMTVADVIRLKGVPIEKDVSIKYTTPQKNMSHAKTIKYQGKFARNDNATRSLSSESFEDDYAQLINYAKAKHHKEYKQLRHDDTEKGVVYIMYIAIKSKTVDGIDRQLKQFEDYYTGIHSESMNDKLKYFVLEPVIGRVASSYDHLFDSLEDDNEYASTSTQENFSGLDFPILPTLQDEVGLPIGYDPYAVAKNRIIFDFVGSTKSKAVIAIPTNASDIYFSYKKNDTTAPISSVLAMTCANQFVMEGRRVSHIVLNDFDYFDLTNAELNYNDKEFVSVIDVSKKSVNAIQPFGEKKDQEKLYKSYQKKIVAIFQILQNFTMPEYSQSILQETLRQTYAVKNWSSDSDIYIERQKLVGQDPSLFPTIGDSFNSHFRTAIDVSLQNNMEKKATLQDNLKISLEGIISQNMTLLGRKTELTPPTAYQTFYDFRAVGDTATKQIQFVNLLNFIGASLKEGDLIVIHGADVIDKRLYGIYLHDELDIIQSRGIKVLYSFDTTSESVVNGSSIFELGDNLLYQNFMLDIDWSIIGRVDDSTLKLLEKKIYRNKLDDLTRQDITSDITARTLVVRPSTMTIHTVDLRPYC